MDRSSQAGTQFLASSSYQSICLWLSSTLTMAPTSGVCLVLEHIIKSRADSHYATIVLHLVQWNGSKRLWLRKFESRTVKRKYSKQEKKQRSLDKQASSSIRNSAKLMGMRSLFPEKRLLKYVWNIYRISLLYVLPSTFISIVEQRETLKYLTAS